MKVQAMYPQVKSQLRTNSGKAHGLTSRYGPDIEGFMGKDMRHSFEKVNKNN